MIVNYYKIQRWIVVNPETNNVYGSVAFVGYTKTFAEQQLYCKINLVILSNFLKKRIKSVVLHYPVLSSSNTEIKVCKLENRFCGFNTTWANKTKGNGELPSVLGARYVSIDLTHYIVNPRTRELRQTNGWIIKAKTKNGFVAISTGDSFANPQILEIIYQ